MISSEAAVAPAAEPELSPWQRFVAIFTRPASAWSGIERTPQWWYPLLVTLALSLGSVAVLHDRALVPMMLDQWEQAVDEGRMPAEQLDNMESFFAGTSGRLVNMGTQAVAIPLILVITALLLSFGCGFLLGHKLPFRLAFEVACWASLITIPSIVLTTVLAWQRETMEGIHVGFGAVLAGMEPSKWMTALASFLDALGPLALWHLAVMILGASALSGAPRAKAAWALGGIYLVVVLGLTVLGGVFGRAG